MKKTLGLIIIIVSVFAMTSCGDFPFSNIELSGGNNTKTVTFVIDGEETTETFKSGNIIYPEVPEKKNYIFSGWYYDEEGRHPAYLGSSNAASLKLYAIWVYDYESALSEIFSEHIKATVGIKVEHKKGGLIITSSHSVAGSGVIFDEDGKNYYILTNDHVTESVSGYPSKAVTVIDCYGTEYPATVIASDPSLDLSLISIEKTQTPLKVLQFAENAPEAGDVVVAIGQPNGIDNSVTFGAMTKLDKLAEDAQGRLEIPVIWHDAPMDHGSSGGVLLNGDFEIIGINYAIGTSKEDGKFLCGLAVPYDKVLKFTEKYKAE